LLEKEARKFVVGGSRRLGGTGTPFDIARKQEIIGSRPAGVFGATKRVPGTGKRGVSKGKQYMGRLGSAKENILRGARGLKGGLGSAAKAENIRKGWKMLRGGKGAKAVAKTLGKGVLQTGGLYGAGLAAAGGAGYAGYKGYKALKARIKARRK